MLSAADSLMWDALEIGPQWILRETEDVTLEIGRASCRERV